MFSCSTQALALSLVSHVIRSPLRHRRCGSWKWSLLTVVRSCMDDVLDFQGCCSSNSPFGGLTEHKCILSQFWRPDVWNQGVSTFGSFQKLCVRIWSRLLSWRLVAAPSPWCPLVWGCFIAVSASIFPWLSPQVSLCLYVKSPSPFSFKDTSPKSRMISSWDWLNDLCKDLISKYRST